MYDIILFVSPWLAGLFLFGVVVPVIANMFEAGHPSDKTTIEESGEEFPI